MFGLGPIEIVVIGAIAVMLYGKRLPEVGRTVGQGIGELRKQMATLSRDMDLAAHVDSAPSRRSSASRSGGSDHVQAAAPRFDPPAAPGETGPS